eukprot:748545-Hanusia_phi.AAC.2
MEYFSTFLVSLEYSSANSAMSAIALGQGNEGSDIAQRNLARGLTVKSAGHADGQEEKDEVARGVHERLEEHVCRFLQAADSIPTCWQTCRGRVSEDKSA